MSTLNVANITDGTTTVGTSYVVNGSAKAWVNLNGTGTIAARDSLNVSSLTDNGTGRYVVNVTNSFASNDYSVTLGGKLVSTGFLTVTLFGGSTPSASQFEIASGNTNEGVDVNFAFATAHGDLA